MLEAIEHFEIPWERYKAAAPVNGTEFYTPTGRFRVRHVEEAITPVRTSVAELLTEPSRLASSGTATILDRQAIKDALNARKRELTLPTETERDRQDRLRRLPTEEITTEDCAYCQQLRGERFRRRSLMPPCPMHGTEDTYKRNRRDAYRRAHTE